MTSEMFRVGHPKNWVVKLDLLSNFNKRCEPDKFISESKETLWTKPAGYNEVKGRCEPDRIKIRILLKKLTENMLRKILLFISGVA